MEKDIKKNMKNKKKFSIKLLVIILVLLIIGITIMFMIPKVIGEKDKKEVITTAALTEIINVSELNTFQAVYNGVAKVMNEKKSDRVDYYVSYEAKIYAGFDFDKLEIIKKEEAKKIVVTIPMIEIKEVNVDIISLDFMFQNSKADESTVSEEAYKACIVDAKKESESESKIYDLAKENAKNIVKALINPFIEEFDSEYELEIK